MANKTTDSVARLDIVFFTKSADGKIEVNAYNKAYRNKDGKVVALYHGSPAVIDEGLWLYRTVWNKLCPYMYEKTLEIEKKAFRDTFKGVNNKKSRIDRSFGYSWNGMEMD